MRTVKLSFLSCGFKGVRQTTAGNTHCWGVVRVAVVYVMTSLFVFFPEGMLDNDCWAMEIIWRNLERIKEILSDLKTRDSEN